MVIFVSSACAVFVSENTLLADKSPVSLRPVGKEEQMFNDPISDMLTRIRNAVTARRSVISMPYSKIKEAIAAILKKNGYIVEYSVTEANGFKSLELILPEDSETITSLIRVSKPGRRVYVASSDIPTVLGGRGIVIVSTSNGLMTGRDARRKGLGGELICKVW
jgi:small subunit ribosomal protein S8